MLSLTHALGAMRMPEVLVTDVQSYLTLQDWKNWRVTSKQAFYDVEDAAKKKWVQFIGLTKDAEDSWFISLLNQTYECIECTNLDLGSVDSRAVQLCQFCFVYSCDAGACNVCQQPFFYNNGETCTECDTFYCDNCLTEHLDLCLTCDHLFCFHCLNEHNE